MSLPFCLWHHVKNVCRTEGIAHSFQPSPSNGGRGNAAAALLEKWSQKAALEEVSGRSLNYGLALRICVMSAFVFCRGFRKGKFLVITYVWDTA